MPECKLEATVLVLVRIEASRRRLSGLCLRGFEQISTSRRESLRDLG